MELRHYINSYTEHIVNEGVHANIQLATVQNNVLVMDFSII